MFRSVLLALAVISTPSLVGAVPILFFSSYDTMDQSSAGVTVRIDPNDFAGRYNAVDFEFTAVTPVLSPSSSPSNLKSTGSGTESGFNEGLVLANGFFFLGLTSTTTELSGSWASFGPGNTAISQSSLDFADLVVTNPGAEISYTVTFASAGSLVDRQSGTIQVGAIPLPATAPLLAGAFAGFFWLRRRKARG
ncbi:MAG: hypothetical protein AAF580_08450 [Pseudomonadota bacterium]